MTLHHLLHFGLAAGHLHFSFGIFAEPFLDVAALSEALGRGIFVVHLCLTHLFLVGGRSSMRGVQLHVICQAGRVGDRQHVLSSASFLASRLVSHLSLPLEGVVHLDIELHLDQLVRRLNVGHIGACPHILRIFLDRGLYTHFALELHLRASPVGVLV